MQCIARWPGPYCRHLCGQFEAWQRRATLQLQLRSAVVGGSRTWPSCLKIEPQHCYRCHHVVDAPLPRPADTEALPCHSNPAPCTVVVAAMPIVAALTPILKGIATLERQWGVNLSGASLTSTCSLQPNTRALVPHINHSVTVLDHNGNDERGRYDLQRTVHYSSMRVFAPEAAGLHWFADTDCVMFWCDGLPHPHPALHRYCCLLLLLLRLTRS